MDKSESLKKEHQCAEIATQAILDCKAILECEATCRDILKCLHEPVAAPKVKKERQVLDGITEFIVFWN